MTKREEDKLNMYHSVITQYEQNVERIQHSIAMQNAHTVLKTIVAAINTTVQQQLTPTKGHAINKANNKKWLSNFGNEIAGALFAWATDTNNPVIKEKVRTTFTALYRLRDEELGNVCKLYHGIANANQTVLIPYGLTLEVLDAYKQAIDNYQISVPSPRNARADKSAYRVKLTGLFKKADDLLKNKIDKLSLSLKKTAPDYIEAYKSNRRIVNSGANTTALRIVIKDGATGEILNGATIQIEALNIKTVANKNGEVMVRPIPQGTHTLVIEKEGYQAQILIGQKATLGKTNTVEVILKKEA